MTQLAALVATLAARLFTGAAVYITFVEHPARVSCGSVLAVTEFGPSYKRATVMQASLALIGAGAGIGRWAAGGGLGWLVGGVLLGSVVPFTLIAIYRRTIACSMPRWTRRRQRPRRYSLGGAGSTPFGAP